MDMVLTSEDAVAGEDGLDSGFLGELFLNAASAPIAGVPQYSRM